MADFLLHLQHNSIIYDIKKLSIHPFFQKLVFRALNLARVIFFGKI